MSAFFVDTSALAKRYIIETGSIWVRSWALPKSGHAILISRLTTVEMVSVLMRKQRAGSVQLTDVLRIRNNFFAHIKNQYTVFEIDAKVLTKARSLLVQHQLRTLDALQLASALQVVKILGIQLTFICADTHLLAAAAAEGLLTDNPNAHP